MLESGGPVFLPLDSSLPDNAIGLSGFIQDKTKCSAIMYVLGREQLRSSNERNISNGEMAEGKGVWL